MFRATRQWHPSTLLEWGRRRKAETSLVDRNTPPIRPYSELSPALVSLRAHSRKTVAPRSREEVSLSFSATRVPPATPKGERSSPSVVIEVEG